MLIKIIIKLWIKWISPSKRTNSKRKGVDKYRQKIHTERRKNQRFYVDNVDKLFSKEGFADFYDISGSHGYQQISVHTIF